MGEGFPPEGAHGRGVRQRGYLRCLVKAVVALQDAQREVLQQGRLVRDDAAVGAHLHALCIKRWETNRLVLNEEVFTGFCTVCPAQAMVQQFCMRKGQAGMLPSKPSMQQYGTARSCVQWISSAADAQMEVNASVCYESALATMKYRVPRERPKR